jgi:hypothetical protein
MTLAEVLPLQSQLSVPSCDSTRTRSALLPTPLRTVSHLLRLLLILLLLPLCDEAKLTCSRKACLTRLLRARPASLLLRRALPLLRVLPRRVLDCLIRDAGRAC